MIVFSIHPLSVLLGFFIGYMVTATIWIFVESKPKDNDAFSRGWNYGYEYGKGVGRSEMLKELEKKKEGDQE